MVNIYHVLHISYLTRKYNSSLFARIRLYKLLFKRVFLSRNYRLIVVPRKFYVLKTNICPRREGARLNMLVLKSSNFQGATRTDNFET